MEYYEREWEREMWEVEHFPDAERAELYPEVESDFCTECEEMPHE